MYASSSKAATPQAAFNIVAQTASELGFEHCSYEVRLALPVAQPRFLLLDNFDDAWRRKYQLFRSQMPRGVAQRDGILEWPLSVDYKADLRYRRLVHFRAQTVRLEGYCGRAAYFTGVEQASRETVEPLRLLCLAHLAHWCLNGRIEASSRSKLESLSGREVEVLRWAADGKTAAETARLLDVSENTVNFHFKRAREKLGSSSKTSLVVTAAMLGMLTPN